MWLPVAQSAMKSREVTEYRAHDSTSEVAMALYNAPTLTGAFEAFLILLLRRMSRTTIMRVRRALRAMETE